MMKQLLRIGVFLLAFSSLVFGQASDIAGGQTLNPGDERVVGGIFTKPGDIVSIDFDVSQPTLPYNFAFSFLQTNKTGSTYILFSARTFNGTLVTSTISITGPAAVDLLGGYAVNLLPSLEGMLSVKNNSADVLTLKRVTIFKVPYTR